MIEHVISKSVKILIEDVVAKDVLIFYRNLKIDRFMMKTIMNKNFKAINGKSASNITSRR